MRFCRSGVCFAHNALHAHGIRWMKDLQWGEGGVAWSAEGVTLVSAVEALRAPRRRKCKGWVAVLIGPLRCLVEAAEMRYGVAMGSRAFRPIRPRGPTFLPSSR
jgi:hypothetical protein